MFTSEEKIGIGLVIERKLTGGNEYTVCIRIHLTEHWQKEDGSNDQPPHPYPQPTNETIKPSSTIPAIQEVASREEDTFGTYWCTALSCKGCSCWHGKKGKEWWGGMVGMVGGWRDDEMQGC